MKITGEQKAMLAVFLVLTVVMVSVGLTSYRLVDNFANLERQTIEKDAQRVERAIYAQLDDLMKLVEDYAFWDDAYEYMQTQDPAFIENNFLPESLDNLQVNFVLLVDTDGNILVNLFHPTGQDTLTEIPAETLLHIRAYQDSLLTDDVNLSRRGFVILHEGPTAFATSAMLPSDLNGPRRGTLIMGRILDDAYLAEISDDLRIDLFLAPYASPEAAAVRADPNTFIAVTQISEDQIAGGVRVHELQGGDSFVIGFRLPRSIYASGQSTTYILLGIFVIFGVICAALLIFLILRLSQARQREETRAEYFRLLDKNSREMVLFASYPDLQIIEANQAVLDTCGLTRDEMARRRIPDLGDAPWDLTLPEVWQLIDKEGAVFEGNLWRNNSPRLPVEVNIEATNENGRRIYTFLLRDISTRLEHERVATGMNQISNALRTTLSVQESVPILLRQVLEMFQADGAVLILREERQERFQLYQAAGEWETINGLDLTRVSGLMQDYFSKRAVITTGVARFFLKYLPGFTLPFELREIGAVRILNQDRLIGVLVVGRARAFNHSDELLLEAISDQAASTLHRASLFEQMREYARQVEAVEAVGRNLTEILDPDEINARLADGLLSTFDGLESVSVWQIDPERSSVKRALGLRYDGSALPTAGDGHFSEILKEVRVQHPRLVDRTTLILPAVRNELVRAVLELHAPEPDFFTPEKMDLMGLVASSAGIAYENALLYTEVQKRLSQLQSLREIDTAIVSTFDDKVVLRVLLDQFCKQLGVDAAVIWKPDANNDHFVAAQSAGLADAEVEGWYLDANASLAGQSLRENAVLAIEDGAQESEWLHSIGYCCGYAAPMIARGAPLGTIEVFSRDGIAPDGDWFHTFETLSRQGAVALSTLGMFKDLQAKNIALVDAYNATIEGWARALDLRDHETRGHSLRVTEMTVDLARYLGVPEGELEHIRRGALLHDIGKMGISDSILLKAGSLDDKEWETMRLHPVLSAEFLKDIGFLQNALDIPLYHHEWWNGSGYPRGLRGEEIPLAARIFAVVDVWDALNSDRPYRLAWPEEAVLPYIVTQSGTHFDPKVVDAFVKFLAERK